MRDEIERGTKAGKLASRLNSEGKLFPDELIIDILADNLPAGPALLDGFPRTETQAAALDAMAKKLGRRITHIICLDVDIELLRDRILHRRMCADCKTPTTDSYEACCSCGGGLITRADDNADTLISRIDRYKLQTLPVATNHYKGRTVMIDGNQNIFAVAELIARALG